MTSAPELMERWRRRPVHEVRLGLYHARQAEIRAAGRLRHWALAQSAADRIAERRGCRILHCLGDSHSRVFNILSKRRDLLTATWLDVTVVTGATALGLGNPNSRTNAIEIFRRNIRPLPQHRPLLFLLGEVDCGYLVWYRAQQRGTLVDEEFEKSMANYVRFLDGLLAEGRRNLILATAPLPTIEDYATWEGLDNMRQAVTASIEERTDMTKRWNGRLRAWAADRKCQVLDTEPDQVDPATGLVRPSLKSADSVDHHLDRQKFAEIVARRLGQLGFH